MAHLQEERTAKKKAEEAAKLAARAEKMAEFEKWKNTSKPNFIISKRSDGGAAAGDGDGTENSLLFCVANLPSGSRSA